jgi:hypothetical protein
VQNVMVAEFEQLWVHRYHERGPNVLLYDSRVRTFKLSVLVHSGNAHNPYETIEFSHS